MSQEVAEKMALACQVRAEQLSEGSLPTAGVACTAALVTDRQRRGDNRAHIALATSGSLASSHVALEKGLHDRVGAGGVVWEEVRRVIGNSAEVAS